MNTEGVYNLVAAIINLAKRDYNAACENDSPMSEYNSKASLENFFHSEWFEMLTLGMGRPEAVMAQAKVGDYAKL